MTVELKAFRPLFEVLFLIFGMGVMSNGLILEDVEP